MSTIYILVYGKMLTPHVYHMTHNVCYLDLRYTFRYICVCVCTYVTKIIKMSTVQ